MRVSVRYGPLQRDLFALCNDGSREIEQIGPVQDAFTLDWRGERNLVVPPVALLTE